MSGHRLATGRYSASPAGLGIWPGTSHYLLGLTQAQPSVTSSSDPHSPPARKPFPCRGNSEVSQGRDRNARHLPERPGTPQPHNAPLPRHLNNTKKETSVAWKVGCTPAWAARLGYRTERRGEEGRGGEGGAARNLESHSPRPGGSMGQWVCWTPRAGPGAATTPSSRTNNN